jgi:predicted Zn-dependent protease with MMP-like domain
MSAREFDEVVARALDGIPERFRPYLENVAVVSRARPSEDILRDLGIPPGETILGLYEGVALPEREGRGLEFPDEIVVFREPLLEAFGGNERELRRQIRVTVLHEIGHHFGMSDEDMRGFGGDE